MIGKAYGSVQQTGQRTGIYFHIPYCRQVCYYCDFHFSLSCRDREEMVAAMLREMALRAGYLDRETAVIDSIYFGGGTPSVLELAELGSILDRTMALFRVSRDAEITLEANPDDLGDGLRSAYLSGLRALGVNRLSIGVQSFDDRELKVMNRRHSAEEAARAVEDAFRCGFENVSLDLIYGLPGSTPESWSYSLDMALGLSVPHLSCYCLAFEEKTAFADFRKKGKLRAPSEAMAWMQYGMLCGRMGERGYEHYEIANFAREGWQSRHNRAYWSGKHYLGIGPAAHSFDGASRQWNIAHNRKYREAVARGEGFYEREGLSDRARFHDYLVTRLRTARGIDTLYLQREFPAFYGRFGKGLARYLHTDLLEEAGGRYRLTEKGMFVSDGVIGDLFS